VGRSTPDGAFVYGSRLAGDVDFLGEPVRGADPRPLSSRGIARFAGPGPTAADATGDEPGDALSAVAEDHALRRYRRDGR